MSDATRPIHPVSVETRIAGIRERAFTVGVLGLGYVGLPVALTFAEQGFPVLGFDTDGDKITALAKGNSYISQIPHARVADALTAGRFTPVADFARLGEPDAVLLCVPTPLNRNREPDMRFVEASVRAVADRLRPGQLIVLESTTYPGTCDDLVRPILEGNGQRSGHDFYLAYSPEREDPGNAAFATSQIPKVVGGDGDDALALADALYASVVPHTVPVRDLKTAEAVKLTENVFRAVNIALVNELKQVYTAMDIDVWEVIEAAKTKPFGFMPFYPGPGLGGHCIPIDPFYLTWKARAYDLSTRFIELAGEVNTAMPAYVRQRIGEALNAHRKAINGAHILILGLAYKKNVDDPRESPAFRLIDLLQRAGAQVSYHDPFIPEIPQTRDYPALAGIPSLVLTVDALQTQDAVVIVTDHDAIDYTTLAEHAPLIVDTRNAMSGRGLSGANVVKA